MSDIAIRVENLSKLYYIGRARQRHDTLRDAVVDTFKRWNVQTLERSNVEPDDKLWALKDVSFEVQRGEVVGVIGRNGAGKSTLLKILSRITEPTSGRAEIHGRVGSLLEVGTGFHPELTGRENIYLNGAILGMKRAEIDRKFDEIMAFAEIERFLDTPVKRYSSGMYVRLAFAVAAHLEPEILLVDEVLAVGDAGFQKKCLGKMAGVAKEGRTVLFVSHNMGAITRLCERSLWLHKGTIVDDNLSANVVAHYQSQYLTGRAVWRKDTAIAASDGLNFVSVSVQDKEGNIKDTFEGDESITVVIAYNVDRLLTGCQIGVRVYNSEGLTVFTTTDADGSSVSAFPKSPGYYKAHFTIPGMLLAPGVYYIMVAGHLPGRNMYDMIEQTVIFNVSSSGSFSSIDGRLGVINYLFLWETRLSQIPDSVQFEDKKS